MRIGFDANANKVSLQEFIVNGIDYFLRCPAQNFHSNLRESGFNYVLKAVVIAKTVLNNLPLLFVLAFVPFGILLIYVFNSILVL
jgi:hypothetical protein